MILVKFFEQMAHLLIYHEQPERIAHSCSFVMSDLSNSLTVAHLSWATQELRSQSLMCLEQSEWITHSRSFDLSEMSEWANEQWANEQIPSREKMWKNYSTAVTNERIKKSM